MTPLRSIREGRAMSVAELARQTGVSRRMLDYLERGERKPSLDVAQRIAKALRITVARIFPAE